MRQLSSYTRQNQTKRALWELDNLCRTLYILEFIDDAELRQSVQKALNRGEAYDVLRRAVAYVNGGKFRVKTEAEQQIWNECSRLITNAMIHYNTALLSRVYEQKRTARGSGGDGRHFSGGLAAREFVWCDRVQPRPIPRGSRLW